MEERPSRSKQPDTETFFRSSSHSPRQRKRRRRRRRKCPASSTSTSASPASSKSLHSRRRNVFLASPILPPRLFMLRTSLLRRRLQSGYSPAKFHLSGTMSFCSIRSAGSDYRHEKGGELYELLVAKREHIYWR